MKTIFNIKCLLFVPIIFLFLPTFAIWVPGINKAFLINNILFILYATLIIIFDGKSLCNKLLKIYYNTPFKYFIWLILFMILNGIFISLFNFKLLLNVMNSIFMYVVLWILPIFVYFFYIIDKYIKFREFVQVFIIIFWVNLIIGFISWFAEFLNIQFLIDIFNCFANLRILNDMNSLYDLGMQSSNYMAFGLPRLDNLFEEPAFYAKFLFLLLPLIYSIGLSKIRIARNKHFNFLIKRTIIPFTLISIILTFSPIFLIFTIISTLLYFYKEIFILTKKYYLIIFSILAAIIFYFQVFDWSETYISRIINVVSNVKSFEDLTYIEPSLATRLISFYNQILIFCKHILFGVGYSNLAYEIKEQLLHSPIPLTLELNAKLQIACIQDYKMPYNKAFVYEFLAENGIILFSLFCYFYYRLFFNIKYIRNKYIKFKNNFYYVFAKGLNGVLWSLLFMMFYSVFFNKCNELYLCIILAISFIYTYKKESLTCLNSQ